MSVVRDIGDTASVRATFTDLAGAVADPTAVTFRAKSPAGVTASYVYPAAPEVVKESTGIYRFDLPCLLAGTYWVRWEGTGAVTASGELAVNVKVSRVLP